MRSRRFIGLLTAMATLGGACSFVTSFPDIDVVGGEGVGGEGGDAPCVAAGCQNCLTATCAVPRAPIALVAPPSAPDELAATSVEVVEIVQKSDGPRYVGNFRDGQKLGLDTADGLLRAGDQQIGFIVGPNGERVAGLGSVNVNDTASGQDVVMTAATVADDRLVVAGVFIGRKLVVFPEDIDSNIAGEVSNPGTADDDFVPFLIWFSADNDFVEFSLDPIDSGELLDNGYITDVAALPGGEAGRVVAMGVATRDPFGQNVDFQATSRYYLVVSVNQNPSALVALDKSACGNVNDLDARRSSVAVDASGQIWAAGTGCPLAEQGDDQSFITRVAASLEGETTLTMDIPDSPIGITEIAVSDAIVAVAGTYSGTPIAALDNGDPIPAGQPGDGFVMAFAREGWGNQSKPIWFRRIASDGGDARVETLAVDGERVFVGGRMGANGGIGDAEGCWASTAPGRGRAFFAQLAEANGTLDWLHVEGFEAAQTEGLPELSARGMALSPVNGGLLTATGFHGELLLQCGPDATNDTGNPEVWLRRFDLQ